MTKKKIIILGFVFGLIAPVLLIGLALQSNSFIGSFAQGFIEFSFVALGFFSEPFGNLSTFGKVGVYLSSGILWLFLFWGLFNISKLIKMVITLYKIRK